MDIYMFKEFQVIGDQIFRTYNTSYIKCSTKKSHCSPNKETAKHINILKYIVYYSQHLRWPVSLSLSFSALAHPRVWRGHVFFFLFCVGCVYSFSLMEFSPLHVCGRHAHILRVSVSS